MVIRSLACATLCALTLLSAPLSFAETNYVSDVLFVPLRSGPSSQHRIVHKGLKSGTAVVVIKHDAETKYSFVRTEKGIEGYIPTRYLMPDPIAVEQLAEAKKLIEKLKADQSPAQKRLHELEAARVELTRERNQLTKQVEELSSELERIRGLNEEAIALDEKNRRLTEANQQLQNELEAMAADNSRLKDDSDKEWFKLGGAAVILGLFLGIFLPMLRPRRKSSW